jgi:hypothetical protein
VPSKALPKKNIKRSAAAAKRKRIIAHLPKATRSALGMQAAKVAKQKRRNSQLLRIAQNHPSPR